MRPLLLILYQDHIPLFSASGPLHRLALLPRIPFPSLSLEKLSLLLLSPSLTSEVPLWLSPLSWLSDPLHSSPQPGLNHLLTWQLTLYNSHCPLRLEEMKRIAKTKGHLEVGWSNKKGYCCQEQEPLVAWDWPWDGEEQHKAKTHWKDV